MKKFPTFISYCLIFSSLFACSKTANNKDFTFSIIGNWKDISAPISNFDLTSPKDSGSIYSFLIDSTFIVKNERYVRNVIDSVLIGKYVSIASYANQENLKISFKSNQLLPTTTLLTGNTWDWNVVFLDPNKILINCQREVVWNDGSFVKIIEKRLFEKIE
jgi:hypothetical protein